MTSGSSPRRPFGRPANGRTATSERRSGVVSIHAVEWVIETAERSLNGLEAVRTRVIPVVSRTYAEGRHVQDYPGSCGV